MGYAAAAFLLLGLGLSTAHEAFRPKSIPFADLVADDAAAAAAVRGHLEEELSQHGLVTVAGIPGYRELRAAVLQGSHRCAEQSPQALTHTFPDGTQRRTLATLTGAQRMDHGCPEFQQTSDDFRALVAKVTDAFVHHLSTLVETDDGVPMLRSTEGGAGPAQPCAPRVYRTAE